MRQKVQALGIDIGKPESTTCAPGDPSLYSFECVAQSNVTNSKIISDSAVLAQRLQMLDQQLKADGWRYGSNDFRYQTKLPYAQWAARIATYGMDIEYVKGTCDFEAYLAVTSITASRGTPDGFSCALDDGPPTDIE